MSMWLMLAKIEVGLLEAIRADPQLLDKVLGEEDVPSVGFDAKADRFEADYRTLSAISEVMPSQDWFEKATGGTESLDYDFTYGEAFALGPQDVSEVAAGLVAEGWFSGPAAVPAPTDETDASVERSARALGEAAEWDPDEIEEYGPMMAATATAGFNAKVVQAIGASAGWDSDTIARVSAAVAAAEPEDMSVDDENDYDNDIAGFFLAAAAQGRAIVGGIN